MHGVFTGLVCSWTFISVEKCLMVSSSKTEIEIFLGTKIFLPQLTVSEIQEPPKQLINNVHC